MSQLQDQKVLVAGSTGYLGRFLLEELASRAAHVKALCRSPEKLAHVSDRLEVFAGQITDPNSIRGIADGMDVAITAVGITRQRDGLDYWDVDYQGNRNLLDEAVRSGVRKFVFVSSFGENDFPEVEVLKAKRRFVEDLKASGLEYTVVRPNGYFSDIREFFEMARRGRVYVFGNGSFRGNPIHGRDLARFCADAIENRDTEVDVGGPKIYTQREIAEIAFKALDKPIRITRVPVFLARLVAKSMRLLTPLRIYGPVEFMMTVLTSDMVAPTYGEKTLEEFFAAEAAG